jgi:alkanesulfonate monooxygenase SsuD/methylene tetrahydromethanopterin reductase-like flavin-dependent oxidoreductase (luciferase family)
LEGFNINPAERRAMWRETVEQVANMLAMDPYPGYQGTYFSMPPRNIVPKPVQKPHPPLWVACSNRDTIHLAAQLGIGALTFTFIDAAEARHWVTDYYETFKRECVPIGHTVNPNIALVCGFSVTEDEHEALNRGIDGLRFFQFALAHFYRQGVHTPGRTDIWAQYLAARDAILAADLNQEESRLTSNRGAIGTPRQVREYLRGMADIGVDQMVFIQQGGKNKHEDICASLELFADTVMPEFHAEEEARQQRKMAELAPYIEAAFRRKQYLQPLADTDIPRYEAYGFTVAEAPKPVTADD